LSIRFKTEAVVITVNKRADAKVQNSPAPALLWFLNKKMLIELFSFLVKDN
jgi:hypothetical protein